MHASSSPCVSAVVVATQEGDDDACIRACMYCWCWCSHLWMYTWACDDESVTACAWWLSEWVWHAWSMTSVIVRHIGLCLDWVGDGSGRVCASDLPVDVTQLTVRCYLRWLLGRCRLDQVVVLLWCTGIYCRYLASSYCLAMPASWYRLVVLLWCM